MAKAHRRRDTAEGGPGAKNPLNSSVKFLRRSKQMNESRRRSKDQRGPYSPIAHEPARRFEILVRDEVQAEDGKHTYG